MDNNTPVIVADAATADVIHCQREQITGLEARLKIQTFYIDELQADISHHRAELQAAMGQAHRLRAVVLSLSTAMEEWAEWAEESEDNSLSESNREAGLALIAEARAALAAGGGDK